MTQKIGEGSKVQPQTNAKPKIVGNLNTTNFSLQELEEVVLNCNYPMVKASFTVKDHSGKVAYEGAYTSPDQGSYTYALKDILPLGEWKPYETKDGAYMLETAIELSNGQVITGNPAFRCILHDGPTSTEVPGKDLLERLAAIPIAKPGMSLTQLRQICLDFMRLESEFPHKLDREFHYVIESKQRPRTLRAGIVYGGLPYVTVGSGSLYRVAEFYDPATGIIDTSGDIFKDLRLFGNACSGNACISWSRVITSTKSGYTPCMTKANGYIPVGPYKYSRDVEEFVKESVDPNGYDCKDICQENGEQVMYESYAVMEPADGVGNNGHVRMNATKPVVVRLPDGSIDGQQSYALMVEQDCHTAHPNHLRVHPDGSHYTAQGGVDLKYTFKELFDTSYIPFTFAELIGQKEVEIAQIKLSCTADNGALSVEKLREAVLTSNYPISDVFVTIKDQDQKELFRYVHRAEEFFIKSMDVAQILPLEQMRAFAGGHLEIRCQLYNGELLSAFEGLLSD